MCRLRHARLLCAPLTTVPVESERASDERAEITLSELDHPTVHASEPEPHRRVPCRPAHLTLDIRAQKIRQLRLAKQQRASLITEQLPGNSDNKVIATPRETTDAAFRFRLLQV